MFSGAGSRNRTGTPFQARDFESRASTNFAIPAAPRIIADLRRSSNTCGGFYIELPNKLKCSTTGGPAKNGPTIARQSAKAGD